MSRVSLSQYARLASTFVILLIILCIHFILRSPHVDPVKRLPTRLHKYLAYGNETEFDTSVDIKKLKLKLEEINNKRNISNTERFVPMDAHTPLLLVQVHRDLGRLQHLVASLARVRDIQTILLIFSHSFYDERIDRLVAGIDFCRVMRIYYPFSLQLNPHKFPGADVDDCLPGATTTRHCSVRDARLVEHKQHWWWKANFVFHRMAWSGTHRAPVVFLEENDYVAPDLLHVLQYAQRSFQYFPYAEVMSLGGPSARNVDAGSLTLEPWRPPFDVGLAFNKTTWNRILSLSAQYCMHDDTSWSYSLFNLFENFPSGRATMIACASPRVVSAKEFTDLNRLSDVFDTASSFPERVRAVHLFGRGGREQRAARAPAAGGGWADLRDQLLCLDPLYATATEEKRYYDADAEFNK